MSISKILYLSDVDIFTPGGAQESMKILMEELNKTYEFYLIGPNGSQINNEHKVLQDYKNFIVRGKNPLELIKLAKAISHEIKRIDPDIIHVQMPSTLVIVDILLKVGLINKDKKIVYTDRGVYGKYGKITTFSINSIIKNANRIVTTTFINQNNYFELYKCYKGYKNKFEVIYNTAGKLFDEYDENKRYQIRSKYYLKDEFVVGFCGRYNEQKNWPLTSEIIKLYKKDSNIKFILVLGTDGSKENYENVIKYIKDLKSEIGNDKILSFINIINSEMADIYYAIDCFVLTSKWESFGRTAIEAMSRKNAVIGTGVDGLSEVIGSNNFIFQTAEGAANIINDLINDNKKLIRTKEFFYNRYHDVFGYKANIEKHKHIYNEILNY